MNKVQCLAPKHLCSTNTTAPGAAATAKVDNTNNTFLKCHKIHKT